MASVKTSISVSTGAKKPDAGPGPGASASQTAPKVPAPIAPAAPKMPQSHIQAPKAPAAPKTPIAKEQLKESSFDAPKQPKENTLDYSKINEIKQQKNPTTLDYSKINAKPEQPQPHVLDYKEMQTKKPWSGAVDKKVAVNQKLQTEANMPAIDALKAKRMFRQKYLGEKVRKQESTPTPAPQPPVSQPPLSSAGSQSNVAKFNAGMNNQPGLVDTISSIFKDEKEPMQKKQGVPTGVSPEKHERCVKDVKAKGHGKVSAIKICNASMTKEEANMKLKQAAGKKTKMISKSERDFIKEDLARPYVPFLNDIDTLVKKEFKPLEEELILDVATRLEKGELTKAENPLDKYKVDKGGSLKFGTHIPTVGFPRNTLDSKENPKAGSDEGSGGEIKKFAAPAPAAPKPKMPKMTKAEIEAECKEDFKPRFRKSDDDVDKKLGVKDSPERQAKVKEMSEGLKSAHDKLSGNPVFNKKIRPNND